MQSTGQPVLAYDERKTTGMIYCVRCGLALPTHTRKKGLCGICWLGETVCRRGDDDVINWILDDDDADDDASDDDDVAACGLQW